MAKLNRLSEDQIEVLSLSNTEKKRNFIKFHHGMASRILETEIPRKFECVVRGKTIRCTLGTEDRLFFNKKDFVLRNADRYKLIFAKNGKLEIVEL